MAENFSNLGREIDIKIQEAHRIPNRLNSKRALMRHKYKLSRVKDKRILKPAREKR